MYRNCETWNAEVNAYSLKKQIKYILFNFILCFLFTLNFYICQSFLVNASNSDNALWFQTFVSLKFNKKNYPWKIRGHMFKFFLFNIPLIPKTPPNSFWP